MQYVRSIGGSVSKTWNSINPATLSGAIDVIVVEQEDGIFDSPLVISVATESWYQVHLLVPPFMFDSASFLYYVPTRKRLYS